MNLDSARALKADLVRTMPPACPHHRRDLVDKLGRATGRTRGKVTAIEVDTLVVASEAARPLVDRRVILIDASLVRTQDFAVSGFR